MARMLTKCVFAMAALLLVAGAGLADVKVVQVNETPEFSMMGQTSPARSDTMTIWLSADYASVLSNEGNIIFSKADEKMYFLNPDEKKYAEVLYSDLGDPSKMAGLDPDSPEAQQMKAMMDQMMKGIEMSVTPTEETAKVGDWDAKKYVVTMTMPMMGTVTNDMWVSTQPEIDMDLFKSATLSMMATMPGMQEMADAMMEIEGMPVKTVAKMNMMGAEITSTNTVISIDKGDPPAGVYAVPEDYVKTDLANLGLEGAGMPGQPK